MDNDYDNAIKIAIDGINRKFLIEKYKIDIQVCKLCLIKIVCNETCKPFKDEARKYLNDTEIFSVAIQSHHYKG